MVSVSTPGPPERLGSSGMQKAQAMPASEVLIPDFNVKPQSKSPPMAQNEYGAVRQRDMAASTARVTAAPASIGKRRSAVNSTAISSTATRSSAMARVSRKIRRVGGSLGPATARAASAKAMSVAVGIGQPLGLPP